MYSIEFLHVFLL